MSAGTPPTSRRSRARRTALVGSAEYQPYEIRSVGGGIDRTIRQTLTDPGKWWDSDGMAPRRLRAEKAGGFEALLPDLLSPPFSGEFSRGAIFYLSGSEAYWELYGFDPASMVFGDSGANPYRAWEFKLEGDPESFWTRIDDIAVVGGAPASMRKITFFGGASYPTMQFGDPSQTDVAMAAVRKRPQFRMSFGRLGSVGGDSTQTCQVNLVEAHYVSPDDERLILGTPRMVYRFDLATRRADYTDHINPIYTTGTISTIGVGSAGATSLVTGAGTGWNGSAWPLPVQERWLFKLDEDPDSYWTEVDSATNATTIELKYNYPKALGGGPKAYTLIRVWQAVIPPELARLNSWSAAQWGYDSPGRRLIITNGIDAVLQYDGGTGRLAPLSFIDDDDPESDPLSPTFDWARFVLEFKEHLILGYFKKGAVVHERGVAWSIPLDCERWRHSYARLLPGAGEITGLGQLGDLLVVFTDRAIYAMRYLGSPFWFGIAQRISDVGCIAAGSIQNIRDQQIVFLGEDNLYSYDGVRAAPIGDPVKDLIYPMLNDDNKPLVASRYDETSGRYLLSVPSNTRDDRNASTFAFDVNEAKWSRPLPGFGAIGKYVLAEDDGVVNQDERIVNSVNDIVNQRHTKKTPILVAGDHGGAVYRINGGTNHDGATKRCEITLPLSDLGVPGLKRYGWADIECARGMEGAQVYVGLSNNGEDVTWVGPFGIEVLGVPGDPNSERRPRVWVNKSAHYFAHRIVHEQPDADFVVDGITAWFRWRGVR